MKDKIDAYRDRLAEERAKKRMELGYEPEFSSWKEGFDAALELGKALGRAEAYQEAIYCANARRKTHNNNLETSLELRLKDERARIAKLLEEKE